MSISAIVPVWNGRELLERLLASLEAQTEPAAELLVVDNGSTDGAPELARARGARVISDGPQRRFRRGREPRHPREPRRVDRGAQQRRRTGAGLFREAAGRGRGGSAWFATGKILAAGSDRSHRRHVRRHLPRRHRVARGQRPRRRPAFSRGRVRSGRRPGPRRCFAPNCSSAWGCWKRASNRTWKTWISACAAPRGGSPACTSPRRWHGIGEAPTLGRWHPETVRRMARNQLLLLARHYPRRLLRALVLAHPGGAVSVGRGGPAARRRFRAGCAANGRGLRRFVAARRRETLDAKVLDSVLCANERLIRELQASTGFDSYWKLYFLLTGGGAK